MVGKKQTYLVNSTIVGRSSNHHKVDRTRRDECVDGMNENRQAREIAKGFGGCGAEPFTAACCRNNGSRGHRVNLGSQNLVEDGLCLVLVRVLGKGKFRDQNLAGLGEHALLAG